MKYLTILLFFVVVKSTFANVILPSVFSDHMVLQQQSDVKIWGWANPNEAVVISPSWTQTVYKTKTNKDAKWEIIIKTPNYGGPFTITIKGYNTIVLNDVLIGEVWLCSGQSNMEMTPAWGIENMDEIKKSNNKNIRFFTAPKLASKTPQENLLANWEVSSTEVIKNSSAVAYFFAKRLQESTNNIPVGLIVSAWGGTPAEIWMPKDVIENNVEINQAANKLKPSEWGPVKPARAFNAMVNPLVGYGVSGVLWYQGESNVGALVYEKTLQALIYSWRDLWKKTLPFYVVQIAPFKYGEEHFGGVVIRDAQRRVAASLTDTELIVISDISPINDIHPKNKKAVGERLGDLVLKKHYKLFNKLVESPEIDQIIFNDNAAVLSFKYAEGLYVKDKKSLFEVAGENKEFYKAKMTIKDTVIRVFSKKVKTPKYVRFSWGNTLQSNIFNRSNLPISSFTTAY